VAQIEIRAFWSGDYRATVWVGRRILPVGRIKVEIGICKKEGGMEGDGFGDGGILCV
jgi:hypothetical protein